MMGDWIRTRWNRWVTAGVVLFAMLLCVVAGVIFWMFQPPRPPDVPPTSVVMIIPAPTLTMTPSTPEPTPTATFSPEELQSGISVGVFVQITGTDGEGLRLRTGPGVSNDPRFLGMDSEVFQVEEGPVRADGYTWWFLVAPYDTDRSGWAASTYLSVVENPQQ